MKRIARAVALTGVFLLAGVEVVAQDATTVPEPLEPWVPWVMHGLEYRECPILSPGSRDRSGFACAWPSVMLLEVDSVGAGFRQTWELFADGWVPLPGGVVYWPEQLTVDGAAAAVVVQGGGPAVWLEAGVRRIEGRFEWQQRPERLRVPAATGVVELAVDGRRIDFPQRDDDYLWLGDRPRQAATEASVSITVFRRLEDGSPVFLRTRLMLDVSGPAREVVLGKALPDGFVPTALDAPLPARIEQDGALRMQLRPGSWVVNLSARAAGIVESAELGAAGGEWPEEETWVYVPLPQLRVSQFEGGVAVDPAQAGVPAEWRGSAAYLLKPGDRYGIAERSRGSSEQERNRLQLERSLWLNFDGDGYLARDVLAGTLVQGWRLDMGAPFRLRHASEGGETLLITGGETEGDTGVELRRRSLQLEALSSIDAGAAEIPVSGWRHDLDSVAIWLNLPPNHRLLAAAGADKAFGAWLERWSLLDIFVVLLVSVAAGRLLGWPAATLALAAMALVFVEARYIGWVILNLFIAVALARVAPEGRLRALSLRYRLVALVLAVVVALPFVAAQARLVIYPQLENPWWRGGPPELASEWSLATRDAASMPAAAPPMVPALMEANKKQVETDLALSQLQQRTAGRDVPMERYAPGTLLQTGPGVPDWSWNRYRLQWNGPVTPDQTMKLVLLGPFANSAWRLGAIFTLLALLGWIATSCFNWPPRRGGAHRAAGTAAAILLFAAVMPAVAPVARAEIPGETVLEELQRRLTQPPECAPDCAHISVSRVVVVGDQLELQLAADAMVEMALPVPGASDGWMPREIIVDDVAQPFLLRNAGVAYLKLTAGTHDVRMSGPLAPADAVEIVFPLEPRRVIVDAEGWDVIGVSNGRLTAATLTLQRRATAGSGDLRPAGFPPFVRLRRQIDLGVEWRVISRVDRVAPQSGAIDLKIPLVDGETVLTEGLDVQSRLISVGLGGSQHSRGWESRLEPVSTLRLTSSADGPWTEVWRLRIGSQWRVAAAGLAPAAVPAGDQWTLEFYPRPGETLELAVTRPLASEGPSLAIDGVSMLADVGARTATHTLTIAYRSTRAGEQALQLPADAILESASVDGRPQPLQLAEGRLLLPVVPGAHNVRLQWREDAGLGATWRMSKVDLGMPASNVSMAASMPENRWVLWASGPKLGPAVLYWSELAIFVIVAFALGAAPGTPLRRRDWLLLGLGLSTVSWSLLIAFAIWVFVLAWRGRARPDWGRNLFNALQLGIALFSVFVMISLVSAIPAGLLATPDMHITGAGSHGNELRWFQDQVESGLPEASVLSVPLWVYKGVILAWALWLSFALMRWLPWAWRSWSAGGIWHGRVVSGGGADGAR